MAKPALFVIDDEQEVLHAIDRDLRQRYGARFRILRVASGAAALESLKKLKLRNEPVALLLADQRMPQMSGTEFLHASREYFPKAKRVLLTAYADTEAAIQAINQVHLDYYLTKPWDPPEEKLFPVLNDLLEDWIAGYRPTFDGVRVIGHRWSSRSFQIKDFLARNQVPYQWLNIETNKNARALLEYSGANDHHLPVVIFPDGTNLVEPDLAQLAEKLELKTHAEMRFYDLIICGSGPAGLAAAVYGASEGLRTLMIEREAPGGQAGTSSRIENYLGFPSGLSGADLSRRAVTQATRFGAEILTPQEVVGVRVSGVNRYVKLADGSEIGCYVLLIATGVSYRKLDVPGMDRLTGAGIYYGAANTEAIACRDEEVYIVGGANSAGQAAIYFAKYACGVTMLVRDKDLSKGMSHYLVEQIEQTKNITVRRCTSVVEARGQTNLEEIVIENSETRERETLAANSLFILIGAVPHTEWLKDVVMRDEQGFILSGAELLRDGRCPEGWMLERDPYLLETSVSGIFVAGDVRHGSVKRVASGVGEGSMAVQFIHHYLDEI